MEPYKLQAPDINTPAQMPPGVLPTPPPEDYSVKHHWYRYLQEKGIALPVILIILIPALFAAIVYRYDLYGLVKKQHYTVEIVDSKTLQPLINTQISLRGETVKTNDQGLAEFGRIKVGKALISMSQLNYSSYHAITLVTFTNKKVHVFGLKNIGSEVQLSVVNKITQAPVENALISADNTESMTNSQGVAIMNLPPSQTPLNASINVDNYNLASVLINTQTKNTYSLIPSGKVYYLTNSLPDSLGTWTLVKSNLDGTDQQVIVAGGKTAAPSNIHILNSGSSDFIALFMPDTTNTPTLYVYNTTNGNLATVDQGSIDDSLDGWTPDNILVYTSTYLQTTKSVVNSLALRAYNASKPNSQPYNLDTINPIGTGSQEVYSSVVVLADDNVEYSKHLVGSMLPNDGNPATISSILATNTSGLGSDPLRDLNYSDVYPNPPQIVMTSTTSVDLGFTNSSTGKVSYYSVSKGAANPISGSAVVSLFKNPPLTSAYFASPDGNSQMWSKVSGKNTTIYIGNKTGTSGSAIASLDSSYTPYGWWTNNYILLTKSGGGVYIMPASGVNNQDRMQEIDSYLP